MKIEGIFLSQDHLVENAEVGGCGCTFKAAQRFQAGAVQDLRKNIFVNGADMIKFDLINAGPVIPASAFYAPSGVMNLPENHVFSNKTAFGRIVCNAVLLSAQKNAASTFSADSGEKPSSGCTEAQIDAALDTGSH